MSTETINAAKDCWDYLEGLDSAERLDLVRDENSVAHETKCSGVLAAHVCDSLGLSKSEWGIYLAGFSVPKVHNLYKVCEEYDDNEKVALQWVRKSRPDRIEEYGEPQVGAA